MSELREHSEMPEQPPLKVVAIVQARMGSTRLPGKVLRRLQTTSVLGHVLRRVQASSEIDAVVVATTLLPQDAPIVAEAEAHGALVHRGSEDDVLSRYADAAKAQNAELVVRVTSDCPLLDTDVLNEMVRSFRAIASSGVPIDYLSNVFERSYPRGLDVEVFTYAALNLAHTKADLAYEREHVTPFIYQHPDRFAVHHHFRAGTNLAHLRWTLDTVEDWELIEAIYEALGFAGRTFTTDEVLGLLASRPELAKINAHVEQKKVGG